MGGLRHVCEITEESVEFGFFWTRFPYSLKSNITNFTCGLGPVSLGCLPRETGSPGERSSPYHPEVKLVVFPGFRSGVSFQGFVEGEIRRGPLSSQLGIISFHVCPGSGLPRRGGKVFVLRVRLYTPQQGRKLKLFFLRARGASTANKKGEIFFGVKNRPLLWG